MTINQTPELLLLSGNPVLISVTQTSLQEFHFVHIEIQDFENNIIGTEVLPATADNSALTFNISDYLVENVEDDFDAPKLEAVGLQQTNLTLKFYFRIYETWDNDVTEHNSTLLPDIYTVLQGSLARVYTDYYQNTIAYEDFYPELITNQKKFLTWQPAEKLLTVQQFDCLYYIANANIDIYIKYKVFLDDDTIVEINSTPYTVELFEVYYINTNSIALLEFIHNPKKVVKYEFSIYENGTNLIQTEVRTFIADRTYYNNIKQFIYRNSLGTYDMVEFRGISEHSNEIERDTIYSQGRDNVYFSDFKHNISANSGWFVNLFTNNLLGKQYIIELVNSTDISERIGDNFIKIIPQTSKYKVHTDKNFNYSVEFEYQHQTIDRNYFENINIELPGLQWLFNPQLGISGNTVFDGKFLSDANLVDSNCFSAQPYYDGSEVLYNTATFPTNQFIPNDFVITLECTTRTFRMYGLLLNNNLTHMVFNLYGDPSFLYDGIPYKITTSTSQPYPRVILRMVVAKEGLNLKTYGWSSHDNLWVENNYILPSEVALSDSPIKTVGTLGRYYRLDMWNIQIAPYSSENYNIAKLFNTMNNNVLNLPCGEGGGGVLYDKSGFGRDFTITQEHNISTPWGVRQNTFHNNLIYGFELYKKDIAPFDYIRVPYRRDGTKITPDLTSEGYSKIGDRDAGYWHNQAETKIIQLAGISELIAADIAFFWYDVFGNPIPRSYDELMTIILAYIVYEIVEAYKLTNYRTLAA